MTQPRIQSNSPDTDPDLNGLEKFVQEGDRTEPLHFAGREAEIRAVEGLLDSVKEGKAGQTRVITAAPGAGKSALLRKLEARWKKNKTAQPALLEAPFFSDPVKVIGAMFNAIDKNAARRFGVAETRTIGGHTNVKGKAFVAEGEVGGHMSRSTHRTNLPTGFFAAFQELKDRETPVVLLVDEAQLWGANQEAGGQWISSLLTEAHMNLRRLPLLIVAAGLGDAPKVVAERGASKLATGSKLVLGPLTDDEMREVCDKFFDRYRIAGGEEQRAEWTEAIIAGTDGWPRHLTNALRGAAQALIAGQGDLSQSSLQAARESGRGFRKEYCRDQIDPFKPMPELLAAVFSAMPKDKGASRVTIRDAIARAYQSTPILSDEMDMRVAFTTMLHKGLIQEFGDNQYDCPIPSMRTYVEKFCAESGCPIFPAVAEAAPPAAAAEASGGMDMEAG